MKNELEKELHQRGTAELSKNGIVTQVTQALSETKDGVEYLIFGELKKSKIIPIDEACAKCHFWEGKFSNFKLCQVKAGEDGKARGFTNLICPKQFVE